MANRKELGFKDPTYTISFDYEVKFNEMKILTGKDSITGFGVRAEVPGV